jgi:hypothetical protein
VCQEGKSVVKLSLMKEARPIGENLSSVKEINLLGVSSSKVMECNLGSELNDVVMSELHNLIMERDVEVDRSDLADFKRKPSYHQRLLDILHFYGLNGCLSDFSIRRVSPEAEKDFPFLDQFDGRKFSSYVLSARYRSRIKGVDGVISNMFVISLVKKDSRLVSLVPLLSVSKYLQLPESVSGMLSYRLKKNWEICKDKFENRKEVL